jgi:hypothetical protein
MTVRKWKKLGSSNTTPTHQKKRKEVPAKRPKTENIIFIGSEMHYDSFWLKMMFVAAAHHLTTKRDQFRSANKNTIAYVDNGYTRFEKLALDQLAKKKFEIVKLSRSSDIASCMNRDRENYKLQDVVFFSHGVIGAITLNYGDDPDIRFDETVLKSVNAKAFATGGRIYSYACRTGNSVNNLTDFTQESEAKPELSLAQKMADHFGKEVHAFLRRTYYGDVVREKSQSSTIASMLKEARKTATGQVIELPPEHEALPHDGLGHTWSSFIGKGAAEEGTIDYALWRKAGGRALPSAAETPVGLPTEMRVFKPKS